MNEYGWMFDIKIKVGHSDLHGSVIFTFFALYLDDFLMFEHYSLRQ